ncbi:hypothetical protein X747_08850 [Mesorhizobium sp. LNJC384A00]|nr:hypothetical protein X766_27810 [Mesorhizobium sp. LSJC255A00]ESX32919.1 hypothetical protein X765_06255 [Mesorhizobium sp. LSHC440B00]ESX40014.1 hypothetical protein X763_02175 [Mesorhizobium sp. LSHC432A00]ESX44901.1 hypothetical protein X764_01175 [Mesorhizobium sp. LSHC440A00]ESX80018.1 hypothetical protein X757_03640 [Mesorhizobium sp. LSHC414A00]ESY28065.1 hypothetical protein X749_19450 [Mesorhizobium sp. LNJC391B00]ESY44099.1 hypothetical protein X747_08850 [Mesorhizobium sp. LNJC3
MVAAPIDIAQAATATTATLLKWQKSMEERATFRQKWINRAGRFKPHAIC